MNERIKELAMKYANKMGNSVLHNADHLEKFAELIVLECALVANLHNEDAEGVNLGVGKVIKEHFGVE